jgi:hypothetical protein
LKDSGELRLCGFSERPELLQDDAAQEHKDQNHQTKLIADGRHAVNLLDGPGQGKSHVQARIF